MTGLAAGWASGLPVFEADEAPGGICSSYYIRPGEQSMLRRAPEDGEAYRFEVGGGHWIFGGDPAVLRFIRSLTPMKSYSRRSSVYFPDRQTYVPYPLQNHLGVLGKDIAVKALTEMMSAPSGAPPRTMASWLEQSFGPTLTELFFGPFHELYTAGLWKRIAPQDAYKSPGDVRLAVLGALDQAPPVGYNVNFVYPAEGLNTLAQRMAQRNQIQFGRRVAQIDTTRKEVHFSDGSGAHYDCLISTLALNKAAEMAGLQIDEEPDPYTSVLVLNLGARRGPLCPADHWIYVPASRSGFHRVGFYNNVDQAFVPQSSRAGGDTVSLYIERAYSGGQRPSAEDTQRYSESVVQELQSWGFIGKVEAVHPTWIEVAYTWTLPGSKWRNQALKRLENYDILMVGRYGRWTFQGIADSLRDGFFAGASLRPTHE